jgi:DNA end-binding protein Ku
MYFETPYYLAPKKKGGEKVYSLLRQALQSTRKVAVATFVMRGRQHLCVLSPNDDTLMLLTLRFADEVSAPAQVKNAVGAGKGSVSPAELSMAKKLIEQMSGEFRPADFKDTYRADLLHRVQDKIRKKQWHSLESEEAPESTRPKAQVIDLMEALKNSLRKKETSSAAVGKKHAKAKRRA